VAGESPEPPSPVAAIVLAAGRSTRFGAPKLMATLRGDPVLRHVVRRVRAASVQDVIVVASGDLELIGEALEGLAVSVVQNPAPAEGLSSSLRVGLLAAPPNAAAFVVALGDQPEIEPNVIDRLIVSWRRGDGLVVVPVYRGERGNPALFDASLRSALLGLAGDRGARDFIEAHPGLVARVAVDGPVPRDVDTPGDLAVLERDLR
jgi:molybdenum cofactor cytidylyltransferase